MRCCTSSGTKRIFGVKLLATGRAIMPTDLRDLGSEEVAILPSFQDNRRPEGEGMDKLANILEF